MNDIKIKLEDLHDSIDVKEEPDPIFEYRQDTNKVAIVPTEEPMKALRQNDDITIAPHQELPEVLSRNKKIDTPEILVHPMDTTFLEDETPVRILNTSINSANEKKKLNKKPNRREMSAYEEQMLRLNENKIEQAIRQSHEMHLLKMKKEEELYDMKINKERELQDLRIKYEKLLYEINNPKITQ